MGRLLYTRPQCRQPGFTGWALSAVQERQLYTTHRVSHSHYFWVLWCQPGLEELIWLSSKPCFSQLARRWFLPTSDLRPPTPLEITRSGTLVRWIRPACIPTSKRPRPHPRFESAGHPRPAYFRAQCDVLGPDDLEESLTGLRGLSVLQCLVTPFHTPDIRVESHRRYSTRLYPSFL
jgi:hypothetical protein